MKKVTYLVMLSCYLVFLLGMANITELHGEVIDQHNKKNILNETIIVEDFDNVTLLQNSQHIDSMKETDLLFFYHYNTSNLGNTTETYVLSFQEFGNCTNFQINIGMNYTSFEDVLVFSSYFVLGSYYDANGNWAGLEGESNSILAFAGVSDPWNESLGEVLIGSYPNDTLVKEHTGQDTINTWGWLDLSMIRNSSGFYTELFYNDTLTLVEYWSNEITKPLNYLAFTYSLGPENDIYAGTFFKDISCTLEFQEITPITPPVSTLPPFSFNISGYQMIISSFTVAVVGILSYIFLKRKKQ